MDETEKYQTTNRDSQGEPKPSNSSPSINIKGLPEGVTVKELLDVESQFSSLPKSSPEFNFNFPVENFAEKLVEEL